MNCRIIKIPELCGQYASVYSVLIDGDHETLLHKFIMENSVPFEKEVKNILMRLNSIGKKTGARQSFFKDFEGRLGDGVCALYDDPKSKLRLYCIRYGCDIVIVGNGGPKSKLISSFQEDPKLTKENYFLRILSAKITERIINKEIKYINDPVDFSGNLEFSDYETDN